MSETPQEPGAVEVPFLPLGRLTFEERGRDEDTIWLTAEIRSIADGQPLAVNVLARRRPDRADDELLRDLNAIRVGFAVPLVEDDRIDSEPVPETPSQRQIEELEADADLVVEADLSGWEDPGERRDLSRTGIVVEVDPRIGLDKKHVYRARAAGGAEVEARWGWITVPAGVALLRGPGGEESRASDNRASRHFRARRLAVIGRAPATRYRFHGYFRRV